MLAPKDNLALYRVETWGIQGEVLTLKGSLEM